MAESPNPAQGRMLGRTRIAVSPLAWGMWRFGGTDVAVAARLVHAALDAGITLLDTADIYGPDNGEAFGAAEALLGQVLAAEPSLRDRMVLATKGGIRVGVPYDSSAAYLTQACEDSLRRLRTDHVDLYQIHRPDTLTHPAELAETLTRLRGAGKIREAGVSNYSPAQTAALQHYLDFPLASTQPEFSALAIAPLGDGGLDQAMAQGMAVLAWSPLAGGRLGGAGEDARAREVTGLLETIAVQQNVPRAAVALAWVMAHPARPIPIIGSQRPERIAEAARAMQVSITRPEWYAILTASRQARLP